MLHWQLSYNKEIEDSNRAWLNSETAKQRNCETGIFLYPDFVSFAKQEKNHQNIFFQLAKQDICTTGFCIQLSICINIESQSDTEKEVRLGLSGETDSFLVGVLFFKMFYSNHQLGPKRILSFSSVIKQSDKVPKPSQNWKSSPGRTFQRCSRVVRPWLFAMFAFGAKILCMHNSCIFSVSLFRRFAV